MDICAVHIVCDTRHRDTPILVQRGPDNHVLLNLILKRKLPAVGRAYSSNVFISLMGRFRDPVVLAVSSRAADLL